MTTTAAALAQLPPPPRRVSIAVYDFPDLTGQRKPTNGVVTDLSTAVSQGSSASIIEALKSAGGGTWFDVVDRTRDADQVRERSVMKETVAEAKKLGRPLPYIRPLRQAEFILNGGVIAFERSIVTSTGALAVTGVGGNRVIVRNFVSVTMRLVRADTSEVVQSVTAHRAIDAESGGLYSKSRPSNGMYPESLLQKYPSPSDFIEAELSSGKSEMTQIATREAIEAALLELISKCSETGVWNRQEPVVANIAHRPKKPPTENGPVQPNSPVQPLSILPTEKVARPLDGALRLSLAAER